MSYLITCIYLADVQNCVAFCIHQRSGSCTWLQDHHSPFHQRELTAFRTPTTKTPAWRVDLFCVSRHTRSCRNTQLPYPSLHHLHYPISLSLSTYDNIQSKHATIGVHGAHSKHAIDIVEAQELEEPWLRFCFRTKLFCGFCSCRYCGLTGNSAMWTLWARKASTARRPAFLEWRSSKAFIIFVVVFAVFTV